VWRLCWSSNRVLARTAGSSQALEIVGSKQRLTKTGDRHHNQREFNELDQLAWLTVSGGCKDLEPYDLAPRKTIESRRYEQSELITVYGWDDMLTLET
jgi:hypothetical protein